MPGFMGDDIGRGEFARIARTAVKPRLDLTEEPGIEKDLLVRRAIERPHRRLRHAATPAAAAAVIATVIDIVAAAEVIVAHGGFSSFRSAGSTLADTQRANHVKFPFHKSITRPAKIT